MHHLRTTLAAGISIAALGLTGCSGGESSGTQPTPSETTSAPTSEAAGPKIANPKDLAAIKDPCQLLKPQQAQQLGTGNPRPDSPSAWGGPTCTWELNDVEVALKPDTVQGNGLSTAMKNEGKSQPDDMINGYPALDITGTRTTCGIYVGPSETQMFIVFSSTGIDGTAPPCELAKQAAGMVLSNLPPMK